MILYHGSNLIINDIDLNKSKPYKDFGVGFYLSDNKEQAMAMANFKIELFGGTPVINCYEFDESILHNKGLKVLTFEDYSVEWAEFVLKNRTKTKSVSDNEYDIVYGPIANDRVGAQIKKLSEGNIEMNEFINRLKYMKGITFQYFFGSEESIKLLRKL